MPPAKACSDHMIHIDEPDITVTAILQMVQQVRG
jgi:hypothetical protein